MVHGILRKRDVDRRRLVTNDNTHICIRKERRVNGQGLDLSLLPFSGQFFPVVSVTNRYNLVDREWEPVVDYCDGERIAFIPWAPLQAGKTGRMGLVDYARLLARPAERKRIRAVARIARRHGATPSQIALAWLLRRSPVVLPIPGSSRTHHVEENVAAAAIELSREDFAALR